jgi:hypothetical protein
MLESHIHAGKQDVPKAPENGKSVVDMLKYGVSITDACVDWPMTVDMLDGLNEVGFHSFFGLFWVSSSLTWPPQAVGKRRALFASRKLNGNGHINGSSTTTNLNPNPSN